MQYLLFGIAALVLFLAASRAFASANPAVIVRQLRIGAGVAALAGAGVLGYRGMAGYAFSLAALGSWLLWGQGALKWSGFPQRRPKSDRQSSRVVTDHLEVELEHDTGAIRGRVLKGFFSGRDLESLKPVELAHLWADCRFADPQSAQILEAYLDRVHPTWRDDMARGEAGEPKGPDGRMTREQALDILGLKAGASEDEIRHAHRELMMKLHPDRGGSTYLAAKINEAKDVLLG
jgi:DnaJ-domain-containing protein 1